MMQATHASPQCIGCSSVSGRSEAPAEAAHVGHEVDELPDGLPAPQQHLGVTRMLGEATEPKRDSRAKLTR